MEEGSVDVNALYEALDAPTRKRYEKIQNKNAELAEEERKERYQKARESDAWIRILFLKLAVLVFVVGCIVSFIMADFTVISYAAAASLVTFFCGIIASADT